MSRKIILLFIVGMLYCQIVEAGTISIPTLSQDSDINIAYFNNSFNTVKNTINGGIESVNIKDDTIAEVDMADAVNPAVREGEHLNAYTKTGMLPATDATLTSDISAGTSYVKGTSDSKLYRVVTTATSKTYPVSKDIWVYIDINGAFQYSEVTVGAAAPTTPANSLLLATVTTDADNITTVTDRRTLSVSLGGNDDYAIKGFEIRCDNASEISTDSGVVYHGTTRIRKTTFTNLTIATAGDWWDGVVDTGSAVFYYIGIDSDGAIKFLGNNPPNRTDTSGNTDGTDRYWYDGTKYWRVLGQIKVDASNNAQPHYWYGSGDYYKVIWNVPVNITTTVSSGTWSAATSCSSAIPAISTIGIFGLKAGETASSRAAIYIRPNGGTWDTSAENGIDLDTAANTIGGQRISFTDSSQQIQYQNVTGNDSTSIDVEGYEGQR